MLAADDLWFGYHAGFVLRGVSLDVEPGWLVGILGPNGAGKTSLLRLLAGTSPPAKGRVRLDDVPLAALGRVACARRIAVVPQETHLAFDYTVEELTLMGRYPHLGPFQVEGPEDLATAHAALEATGTADLAGRQFRTLSGGEKQRVVIASALAQLGPSGRSLRGGGPTRVMLLDEPTASLDPGYQLEIAAILRRLADEERLAIVVSTHDLQFAASVCRRLILLRDGIVLAAGPTEATLTTDTMRRLYDIDADIRREPPHLIVVPRRRLPPQTPPCAPGP